MFLGLVVQGMVFLCRRIRDAGAMSIMATFRGIDLSYSFWTRHGIEDILVRQKAETANA